MAHMGTFDPRSMYQDPNHLKNPRNLNTPVQAHAATSFPQGHPNPNYHPTTFPQAQYHQQHQQPPPPQQHHLPPPQHQSVPFYGHQPPPQEQYYPTHDNSPNLYSTPGPSPAPSFAHHNHHHQQQQQSLFSPGPGHSFPSHGQSHPQQHAAHPAPSRSAATTAEQVMNGQAPAYAQHQVQDLWGGVGVSEEQRQMQAQYQIQRREPNYPQYGQQPPASAPTPNPDMMSSAPSQGFQAPHRQNQLPISPPRSSTPQQQQSISPNPTASSQPGSSTMPNPAAASAAPLSKPATQSSQPVFKTPYPPQHLQANSTPHRPPLPQQQQQQQAKMATPKSSPPANTKPAQSPPNTNANASCSEKDTARINALFKVNSLICRELIKLQEQGLAGPEYQDPKAPKNQIISTNNSPKTANTSSPPNTTTNPPLKRPPLFNDYLRRFQSNLAFLDTFRTRPMNPPNTIYPIRPPIIDVGPSEELAPGPEAEEVREAFRNVRKLWTKEELEGPPYPPGYQEQLERAKQHQAQVMQAQAQAQMYAMKAKSQIGMGQSQVQPTVMTTTTQGVGGQAGGTGIPGKAGGGASNIVSGGGSAATPAMVSGVTTGSVTTSTGTPAAVGMAT